MFTLTYICACSFIFFVDFVHGSTLTTSPFSVLVISFENIYDISLLANTLSDQGINVILVIPEILADNLYENIVDVEVYQLKGFDELSMSPEDYALKICECFLNDKQLSQKVQEFRADVTLFPALRHDGCLLPWIKSIGSVPVIVTRNAYEETYVFEHTGVAMPLLKDNIWFRIFRNIEWIYLSHFIETNYIKPVFHLVKHCTNLEFSKDNLYSDVRLVFWGTDTVLRMNHASLSQMLVEIGCHHCRGPQPLPEKLQKLIVEYRLGTIVVLLNPYYKLFVEDIARKVLPGRQGQAMIWKIRETVIYKEEKLPANLHIWRNVDRQDLIGNGRTRLVLSHCTDTELIEIAFHGTPVICFPRDGQEHKNAARAIDLGFAHSVDIEKDRMFIISKNVLNIIKMIYESMNYRENARKVSVALRDKLNPPSDRMAYWLRYVARTRDDNEKFLVPPAHISLLYEDFQFFLGQCVGVIVGFILGAVTFLFRHIIMPEKKRKSKGRYQR